MEDESILIKRIFVGTFIDIFRSSVPLSQNGLVALVTALTFFSMTYFTVVMKTKQVLSDEIGAVIALSILLNFYVLWIIFDLIVMANAMRYVFSPQVRQRSLHLRFVVCVHVGACVCT